MKKSTNKLIVTRCGWVATGSEIYEHYHDTQWGVAVHDDRVHFEFLILEAAQAGLNWLTILKKRDGYKKAFADFDPQKVALFDEDKVVELLGNVEIIRNQLKIRSAIQNAKMFLEIQKEFGSFDNYVWRFVNGKPKQNRWSHFKEIPAQTDESRALSADLKKRGFKFVGPTVMYAYMQAVGLVDDHTVDCFLAVPPIGPILLHY